jgi:hypothetical protein
LDSILSTACVSDDGRILETFQPPGASLPPSGIDSCVPISFNVHTYSILCLILSDSSLLISDILSQKNTMLRISILFSLFALLSLALAADPHIVFTSTPQAAVVGKTYNLTWSGGDGASQVTIELRRGVPANLMWVAYLTSTYTLP